MELQEPNLGAKPGGPRDKAPEKRQQSLVAFSGYPQSNKHLHLEDVTFIWVEFVVCPERFIMVTVEQSYDTCSLIQRQAIRL